jgi:hypothetical protein
MALKPGVKTTEFWALVSQMVISSLALCGVLTTSQMDTLGGVTNLTAALVYFITNAWLGYGYNQGRVALKQSTQ